MADAIDDDDRWLSDLHRWIWGSLQFRTVSVSDDSRNGLGPRDLRFSNGVPESPLGADDADGWNACRSLWIYLGSWGGALIYALGIFGMAVVDSTTLL